MIQTNNDMATTLDSLATSHALIASRESPPSISREEILAHRFVEGVVQSADVSYPFPLWHGWALRQAYVEGYRQGRADQSIPPFRLEESDTK